MKTRWQKIREWGFPERLESWVVYGAVALICAALLLLILADLGKH